MADIPTISWDEDNPSGIQAKSLGAARIRELKIQLREILAIDHKFESAGQGATWGLHNKITFYSQSSDPSPDANTGVLYSKDVSDKSEIHWIDEDDNINQFTSGGGFSGGMTGEVRMWSGVLADIAGGWALCDGSGGTPNLIGKFIRGINTSVTEPGGTGGSDTVTLATANLPIHTHTVTGGAHNHTVKYNIGYTGGGYTNLHGGIYYDTEDTGTQAESSHTHSIANDGSGVAYDGRPAYLELAFITKT